jgi:NADH-quinone oxidoreductase subunit I
MKDSDVIVLQEPKLSLGDQFYIPQVLNGLGTTMKHMLRVLGGKDRVVQYPEERREDLPIEDGGMLRKTYRGVHRLNKDEQGRPRCVACFMCSTACPARCIHIEADESPWADREKYPAKFDIDELRCIYCGMCEEACPVDAIELTSLYNLTGRSREEMIFDKEKLLSIYDATKDKEPMQSPALGGTAT